MTELLPEDKHLIISLDVSGLTPEQREKMMAEIEKRIKESR